jgi:hypothetical protein
VEKDFQKIRYDIVLIEWDDAVADDISWKSVDSAMDWSEDLTSNVYTVGFLLEETDDYVLVGLSLMPLIEHAGDKDTNVHGVFRIPVSAIADIKVLVKSENIS